MATRKLARSDWGPFLDRMSKATQGKRAAVEVASLDLGDQIAAEWVPLIGLVYDHKNDFIEVALEGLDHMIRRPRELHVDQEGLELAALEVVDAGGARQIIKLKDPLMLPAPAASAARAST